MNSQIYDRMKIRNDDSEDIHKIKARLIELFEIVDNHADKEHSGRIAVRNLAADHMLGFFNMSAAIIRIGKVY